MASSHNFAGLDIGSSFIRVVVAQKDEVSSKPRVIGLGTAPSAGLRRGLIVDADEVAKVAARAIEDAERMADTSIDKVYVAVGGAHISALPSRGVVAVARADGRIGEEDVNRVIDAAQAIALSQNREIIHAIPKEFRVDGEGGMKNVVGMSGVRLEVDSVLITGASPFLRNLERALEMLDLRPQEFIPSSIATARAVLTPRHKELGVMLLDIGGTTTDIAVFEEGSCMHVSVIPIGGAHITNDIAIGLKTSLDVAERIKNDFGSALPSSITKRDIINVADLDPRESGEFSRKAVAEIIEARLEEIFDLANEELKKIERSRMLPAGVVISGGTAALPGILELAKKSFRLPTQLGYAADLDGADLGNAFSLGSALGLILLAADAQSQKGPGSFKLPNIAWGGTKAIGGRTSSGGDKIKRFLKSLLP